MLASSISKQSHDISALMELKQEGFKKQSNSKLNPKGAGFGFELLCFLNP